MNVEKLKEKIEMHGFNIVTFSDAVNIDRSTFYRRLSEHGNTFTIEEVKRMKVLLSLSDEEAITIFLI